MLYFVLEHHASRHARCMHHASYMTYMTYIIYMTYDMYVHDVHVMHQHQRSASVHTSCMLDDLMLVDLLACWLVGLLLVKLGSRLFAFN